MSDRENPETRAKASGKAVEQAYLSLQDAFRKYRRWRDLGGFEAAEGAEKPDIALQDSILTFYELLRPYIRNNPSLQMYWKGAIVEYPDSQHTSPAAALQYYRENSHGIWQIQKHEWSLSQATQNAGGGSATAVADGGETNHDSPETLQDWHRALGLSDSVRILQLAAIDDDWMVIEGRFAVVGLRDLDNWRIYENNERTTGDGFMSSKTSTDTSYEAEPNRKLETAARMLSEVADKLNVIARFDTSDDPLRGTPGVN
jgi:hypothetical protein